MRVISYGGGVQSTAMVIMAATHNPEFEAACGGPIDAAIGEAQTQLPGFESIEEGGCDTGHCFT